MNYPKQPNFRTLIDHLAEYARLQTEQGGDAGAIQAALDKAERDLQAAITAMRALPVDAALAAAEPDDLAAIRALRPDGPRAIWKGLEDSFADKLAGAFLARCAGCTLGAIVEFWEVDAMEKWAAHIGDTFPPVDYWTRIKDEIAPRYGKTPCIGYTRGGIEGVPVDDDITYTQLGLLIAEDHGLDFTVADVGKAWLKYLPYACTAEDIALQNLKAGVPAELAGITNNPYVQWIGADIRADPFGYMAPGLPERAAGMAYYDANISHRRNGTYGEMLFAAAIAAAFAVDDPLEAIRIGLTEIPADCLLARDVRWALDIAPTIPDYRAARDAVDKRFEGMHGVHTNLNACLTVFGLAIGGLDVTRVIAETVAMGQDNDCTAATAGSIVGAIVGKKGVPEHWYKPFGDVCHTYLIGIDQFSIFDLLARFAAQAGKAF